MHQNFGTLYIVPTPIGNLQDITYRSIQVLQEVDLILAEDTRVSGKLLKHYEISKPVQSYHNHNEHRLVDGLVKSLALGKSVALISDAGTPGISDPGFLLVRKCIDQDIGVQCLPGATAFVPALVVSGLPSHRFHFEGFLPHKKGRKTRLDYLSTLTETFILYESPHRIHKCIDQLIAVCGPNRPACICREISKLHEEIVRGTLFELQVWGSTRTKVKGELVVVVEGFK